MKPNPTTAPPAHATYIWIDPSGGERNDFAIFRRRLTLDSVPDNAPLCLFADTRYRLRVNGTVMAHGPARFAPAHPEFDTHDLAPLLKTGENVLTVEVNTHGPEGNSESCDDSRGAFIAWAPHDWAGEDLATPGNWRVTAPDAWYKDAAKYSFNQHAVEVCDTRRLDPAWFDPEQGDSTPGFREPAELDNPDHFGELAPRACPPFSEALLVPEKIEPIRLRADEFRVTMTAKFEDHHRHSDRKGQVAYAFWIYSPRPREINLGGLWGDNFLNGRSFKFEYDRLLEHRQNSRITLEEGWNLLYGEAEILQTFWPVAFAFPTALGLEVRAEPDFDCPARCRIAHPLKTVPVRDGGKPAPTDADSLDALGLEWQDVARDAPVASPARMMRWDHVAWQIAPPDANLLPFEFELAEGRECALICDMGQEWLGHFTCELEAPAGAILDVYYEEARRPDGLLGRAGNFQFTECADRFILRGGRQRVNAFHVRGGRYFQMTFRPGTGNSSRNGTLKVHQAGVLSANVKQPVIGDFQCGDALYNWAWRTCRATHEVCLTDLYIPDLWRERGLAIADNRLQTHINRALSPDLSVSRRSVRAFLDGQHDDGQVNPYMPSEKMKVLADFTVIWVIWLYDHWALSGDEALVRECWPVIENIFNGTGWTEAPSGLWNADPHTPFIDWGATVVSQKAPENACLNAFRIRALQCAAELADVADKSELAAHYQSDAARVTSAWRERLWNPQKQLFAAGREADGSFTDDPATHANILALLFDLCDDNQRPLVLESVYQTLLRNPAICAKGEKRNGIVQLYFINYALAAFYKWDRPDAAEAVFRAHWGMLKDWGALATWEVLKPHPGSHCHVWTSSPLIHMARDILGVRQKSPARDDEYVIEPSAETLDWAEGVYPLLDGGEIGVRWRIHAGVLHIEVLAPDSVRVEVAPRGRLAKLPRHVYREPGRYLA